jgi:Domain of unknown function (DUF932)
MALGTYNGTAYSSTGLDDDQLRSVAPSIFAATPWERMKERYRFIPTIEVVNMLRDKGFVPTQASQSRTRIEGKGDFTKHLLRFQSPDIARELATRTEIPELVLVNSHDGTSAYKFLSGIFRIVCSNGMIVQSQDFGSVSVRHTGGSDFHERVIDASFTVMDSAPQTLRQIEDFRQIELSPPQANAFAIAAHELRNNDPAAHQNTQPVQLLGTRRREDRAARDLWTVSNVIQENIMRGGLRGRSESGRRSTTRPIKSVGEDLRINRALWRLTEEMQKIVS